MNLSDLFLQHAAWDDPTRLCMAVQLWTLRRRYLELVAVPAGDAEDFVLRLSKADAPISRSLRRPIDGVLSFA